MCYPVLFLKEFQKSIDKTYKKRYNISRRNKYGDSLYTGIEQMVARWLHWPEAVGSSPTPGPIWFAGVAQLVVQLICNQQVVGSSPSTSSIHIWPRSSIWLEHQPVTLEVTGSSPAEVAIMHQ